MKHSLHSSFYPHIDAHKFTAVVKKLRQFFDNKGLLEVHTQNRLSILAACENPHNIAKFTYNHNIYPLPQTGQMWLEHELLKNPDWPGVFCISTSYRQEKNPIAGRHEMIFPMFEFESTGGFNDMLILEMDLLQHLGFNDFYGIDYEEVCEAYGTSIIENEHEAMLCEHENVVFLKNFPRRTNPFWNMHSVDGEIYSKCDVIMYGQETIGSAQRSCDPEKMRENFYTIEDGKYAEKLFELFSRERVEKELEKFLEHDFFNRFGGGIGMTRLARAYELLKFEENVKKTKLDFKFIQ